MRTIIFKSVIENWRKEFIGLKNNTVREFEVPWDLREELLNNFMAGTIPSLYIRIVEDHTGDSFTRTVTDVTKFKGLYIISWGENGNIRG